MRHLRFFCEEIGTECILDEAESHHLSKVLRVQEGAEVEVFDGKGTIANAKVVHIDKRKAILSILQKTITPPRQSGRIILAVSYAKGQRFDWLVEKCTELGADHIAAVQFERTVKLGNENAVERLKKISLAAAKQCGRLFLPEISGPERFAESIRYLDDLYPGAIKIFGDAQGKSLHSFYTNIKNQDIIIIVGPEGGFSDEELKWIQSQKIEPISLNRNILRVETAAMAFCAQLSALAV